MIDLTKEETILLLKKLEDGLKEMKSTKVYKENSQRNCQLQLEAYIVDSKIKLYKMLINQTDMYDEETINMFNKKLKYLIKLKESKYIIRYSEYNEPILLKDLKEFTFE